MPLPTTGDVARVLATAKIPVVAADLGLYLRAAVGWWERETGWKPFVGKPSVQTYDPPGPKPSAPYSQGGGGKVLRLRNGLLSVTALTVNGIGLTETVGFFLVKGSDDWPCEAIRFALPVTGPPQSVSIEGVWGFLLDAAEAEESEDLALAKRAIVAKAAGDYAHDAAQGTIAQGVDGLKSNDQSISFDLKALASSGGGWIAQAERSAEIFKRVTSTL